MKKSMLFIWAAILVLSAACDDSESKYTAAAPSSAVASMSPAVSLPATSPSAILLPAVSSPAAASPEASSFPLPEGTVEDMSIRAVGEHPSGQILVQPASLATRAPLGSPSCYGQETDLGWRGDYEAVWQTGDGAKPVGVFTFPADFEIIQRKSDTVKMEKHTLGDTDIFTYVPRYTDCHGLETYLFGVSGKEAFPISLKMDSERVLTRLSHLPNRSVQWKNEEMIITGGYGAGQEFISVYHFHYDPKERSMILKTTDLVSPNDIYKD